MGKNVIYTCDDCKKTIQDGHILWECTICKRLTCYPCVGEGKAFVLLEWVVCLNCYLRSDTKDKLAKIIDKDIEKDV